MCVDWAAEVSETRGNGPRAYREIHGAGMNGLGVKGQGPGLVNVVWVDAQNF